MESEKHKEKIEISLPCYVIYETEIGENESFTDTLGSSECTSV